MQTFKSDVSSESVISMWGQGCPDLAPHSTARRGPDHRPKRRVDKQLPWRLVGGGDSAARGLEGKEEDLTTCWTSRDTHLCRSCLNKRIPSYNDPI